VNCGDDEHDDQNDLQKLQQLLEGDHFESAFLMVLVDASKERVEIHNVVPLSCRGDKEPKNK
jgi:hypothetical protein